MEQHARRELDRAAELARTQHMIFEDLAQMAETIAETKETSAVVHDNAAGHLPGAVEHAARSRRSRRRRERLLRHIENTNCRWVRSGR